MKVDASKAEITRIKNELSPIEERLQDLNSMYDQVTTLERRIGKKSSSGENIQLLMKMFSQLSVRRAKRNF